MKTTAASKASQHPLYTKDLITNPYEGIVFGNGDLAISTQVYSHELRLNIGKNDLWDSRYENKAADYALKHEDLVRYQKDYDFHWFDTNNWCEDLLHKQDNMPENEKVYYACPTAYRLYEGRGYLDAGGPSPKRAGNIHILHPGLSDTKVETKLDISNGLLTVTYHFYKGDLIIESFIHKRDNLVMVRLTAKGEIPWLRIFVEKEPDSSDATMPVPKIIAGKDMRHWGIRQNIPAGCDVGEFNWYVASAFPEQEQCSLAAVALDLAYSLRQDIKMNDGESIVLAVAVATDHDSGADKAYEAAVRLAGDSSIERFERELAESSALWAEYWGKSAVEIEDKELEAVWYRSMFVHACHVRPGTIAPGLCANVPIYDASPFHGYYTWNHNVQKWYVPILPTNHPELFDTFADLIRDTMPVFEYQAKLIFGLEGVYCDLATIPLVPPERAFISNKWGRALALTGWLSLIMYSHYEFLCDKQWLRENAYEYISKAAKFYFGFLEKFQDENGDIFPSMRLEEPGWCKDFVGNKNVVTDLVMFRRAFECAIKASEILGIDEEERKLWKQGLDRVPEIDYGWNEYESGEKYGWYALCKDWEKVEFLYGETREGTGAVRFDENIDFEERLYHMRNDRWGGAGWLVYPGEHLEGDGKDDFTAVMKDILERVDIMKLPNSISKYHGISSVMPQIRLGMDSQWDKIRYLLLAHSYQSGQYSPFSSGEEEYIRQPHDIGWRIDENTYLGTLGLTEMMLQSQGGIIRLFPCWKEGVAVSFDKMRARGGFLVSAGFDGSKPDNVIILSECGNECRIRWSGELSVINQDGAKVTASRDGRDWVFATDSGCEYKISLR